MNRVYTYVVDDKLYFCTVKIDMSVMQENGDYGTNFKIQSNVINISNTIYGIDEMHSILLTFKVIKFIMQDKFDINNISWDGGNGIDF